MLSVGHISLGRGLLRRASLWGALLTLTLLGGPIADASAAGNASAAAGFVENAQNKDGGFGDKHGQASSPTPSLWATVALLAAGKNPRDEWIRGGRSAEQYLVAHRAVYTSLSNLGLLAMVQSAAQAPESRYGDPAAKLLAGLTDARTRRDPGGAALAVLGLLAAGTDDAHQAAIATARVLLASPASDDGWGTNGLSDSVSTALVLQALAASQVAGGQDATVQKGVAYLHKAQGNDGAIAASIRTDQALAGGSVAATAFTIQALDALGLPDLKTPTGTTVRQGLTQYQQKGSGGLTSDGALYSQIPPSVVETAQAFSAFDGRTFPLPAVAATTSGPPVTAATATSKRSKHVSSGSAAQGVSGTSTAKRDAGAFKRGTAAPKTKGKGTASTTAAKPKDAAAGAGGPQVSGDVVGTTDPRLTAGAGQGSGGLTAEQRAAIWLGGALLVVMLLGGFLDSRRPRADARSGVAVAATASMRLAARARERGSLAPLAALLVGVTLIAVPFNTQLWHRGPKGAAMVDAFAPYMKQARLVGFQRDISQLDAGVREAAATGPKLQFPHARSAADAAKRFAASDSEFALFRNQWASTHRSLRSVVDPIQANRSNYDAIAALPSFKLLGWFFVIPGALLVLLAALALLAPASWRPVRWGVAVLGLGLLLAPVAFQMFDRAPKGAKLVRALQTVETRKVVTKVQNDFGSIAIGQGALRTELLPALRHRGLTSEEIQQQLPAVTTLDARWVKILNDLTPMIGVMSDNVANFQAVAALPRFGVFPWLFVLPGLLVLLLVVGPLLASRVAVRGPRTTEPKAARTQTEGAP